MGLIRFALADHKIPLTRELIDIKGEDAIFITQDGVIIKANVLTEKIIGSSEHELKKNNLFH